MPVLQPQNPREFLFRGNAVAAGVFLTKRNGQPVAPDPNVATTHGESCLPLVGGVSRSRVQPTFATPEFFSYGPCETFVWGRHVGDMTATTLMATVANVRLTTSPSEDDDAPGIRSTTFVADHFSIEVESTHPQKGQPSFAIKKPEAAGMAIIQTRTEGPDVVTPVELEFDEPLMSLQTMERLDNEFLRNRKFFDDHAPRYYTRPKLVFGKHKLPRTPQRYFLGSIVRQILLGGKPIPGNSLVIPGFGTISFGLFLVDEYSRRISMAHVRMGSETGADGDFSGVETNGIWK
jgi:hypothetical protein